jgi:Uma2 family endonuclease
MPALTKHRFTTEDYHRMAETGVLRPDDRKSGICEYWIVNLDEKAIEVYREPHLTGYGSSGEKVHPLAFPDALVDVTELMKHL